MRRLILPLMLVLLPLAAACDYEEARAWYVIRVSGPVRFLPETRLEVFEGQGGLGGHTVTDEIRPVTIYLRQEPAPHLVMVTVDTFHKDAEIRTGPFSHYEGDIIARAVWVLSEPGGSEMELNIDPERGLSEWRLRVDRDADGVVEVELEPRLTVVGEQLDPSDIVWKVNLEALVEPVDEAQAKVTLNYPGDVRGSFAGPVHEIVYAVYPDRPELQVYEVPIVVENGNTVQYRIIFQNGGIAEVPDLRVE